MTAIARFIETHWHGPRTRRRNAAHHYQPVQGRPCVTTRRKP